MMPVWKHIGMTVVVLLSVPISEYWASSRLARSDLSEAQLVRVHDDLHDKEVPNRRY